MDKVITFRKPGVKGQVHCDFIPLWPSPPSITACITTQLHGDIQPQDFNSGLCSLSSAAPDIQTWEEQSNESRG